MQSIGELNPKGYHPEIKNTIMKKGIFISILFLVSVTSCKDKKKVEETHTDKATIVQNSQKSEGYKLMEQKCFICHFSVPDRSRKEEMIAPPMLRVQEHYKPAYPNKSDFVNAITAWVKDPTEDKIQMPGAARKFKVMPYLPNTDQEIKLIAETLFEIDFGVDLKGKDHGNGHKRKQNLQLNNGKKWQLNKEIIANVNDVINQLNSFKSDDVKAYNQLGKDIFKTAKTLILDKDIESQKFEEVQAFFHNIEEDIHQLMQVKTVAEGQKQQKTLKKKFSKFFDFFK